MSSNIYFGSYLNRKSIIHRINPLMKLASVAVISSFLIAFGNNIYVLLYCSFIFLVTAYFGKITIKELFLAVKSFRFFIIIIFIIKIIFDENGSFSLNITFSQIFGAFISAYQFMLILLVSSIMTFTSTPTEISKSVFFFIKPLKKFNINTYDIAVAIIIAVRFIPVMIEESSKIITAQKLRGVLPEKTTLIENVKVIFSLDSFLIPLFVRVFNYAENLSITLSYRNNIEQVLILPKINRIDIIFILLFSLSVIAGYTVVL